MKEKKEIEEEIEEKMEEEKEEKIVEKKDENKNNISCLYYIYLDSSNNYQCTMKKECPMNKNKLLINRKVCIDKCIHDDTYIYKYNNKCYQECPLGIKNSNNFLCENIIICFDNSIYLSYNNSCLNECNIKDFLNLLCKINDVNIKNIHGLILKVIDNIKNGTLNDLLANVTNEYKKDISI